MEETSLHVSNNGDSGNASRPSGCIATAEEGTVDDPPPIPSASSSRYLTEKSEGESRFDIAHINNDDDSGHIENIAHTLPLEVAAKRLATDSRLESPDFLTGPSKNVDTTSEVV